MPESTLSAFKEVVVALAALGTAGTAFIGLRSWQREAEWRENRAAARVLVRSVLKTRDAFNHVRSPWLSASEFPDDWNPVSSMKSPQENARGAEHVYLRRLKVLSEAIEELEASALESEVFWGREVETAMREVRACRRRLLGALERHVSELQMPGLASPDEKQKTKGEISGSTDDENNEFSTAIRTALESLLEISHQHLQR